MMAQSSVYHSRDRIVNLIESKDCRSVRPQPKGQVLLVVVKVAQFPSSRHHFSFEDDKCSIANKLGEQQLVLVSES